MSDFHMMVKKIVSDYEHQGMEVAKMESTRGVLLTRWKEENNGNLINLQK